MLNETGEIINQYFEQLIWTNYGGALFTILGRDIGFFILGYLLHIIIETLIEITKGEKSSVDGSFCLLYDSDEMRKKLKEAEVEFENASTELNKLLLEKENKQCRHRLILKNIKNTKFAN